VGRLGLPYTRSVIGWRIGSDLHWLPMIARVVVHAVNLHLSEQDF